MVLILPGCAPFRGDSPPVAKRCQIWVVQQPDNTAVCISRDEWERYWKPVLVPAD